MKTILTEVALAEAKAHLNAVVKDAEQAPVILTRHGKPAAALIGFEDDDAFLEWRLVHDPALREKVRRAYAQIERGETHTLEEVKAALAATEKD